MPAASVPGRAAGQQIGQFAVDAIEQGRAQQQILDAGRLALQHLGDQVLGDRAVAAGEIRDETLRIRVTGQGERREPQARRPPLGPQVQERHPGFGQRDTRGMKQLPGLALGKAQIRRADLGQVACQAQLKQAQLQIAAGGQHRVHVRGKVHQQASELGECLRRGQLVQIINNQRDAVANIGELREHSVDHRPPVEAGCRCWRFRAASWGGGLADRVKQG